MTIDVELDKRLRRIVRKHRRMRTNGVVHRVGKDGLIESRPRLIRPRFPIKGIFITLAFLLAFKSILFAQVGAGNYAQQVQDLRSGTLLEQAGALIMQEDPITVAVGTYLTRYFF